MQEKLQWAKSQRAASQPTIPSTIGVSARKQPTPSSILAACIHSWQCQWSAKGDFRTPCLIISVRLSLLGLQMYGSARVGV